MEEKSNKCLKKVDMSSLFQSAEELKDVLVSIASYDVLDNDMQKGINAIANAIKNIERVLELY